MAKRILLLGGGSGGHAYPLIAVAQALISKAQEKGLNLDLLLMGEGGFLERAARENQFKYKRIIAGKLRRYSSAETIIDLFKIPLSFIQAFWYLFWYMPDAIFSKGGYDSVAPAIVGWLYSIPVYIHESDAVPGLSNRIISRFAKVIFTSFPVEEALFKGKAVARVGNPIRPQVAQGDRNSSLQYFQLSPELKTILVMGGSQGAKAINDAILNGLVLLLEKYQVLHQCGDTQFGLVKAEAEKLAKEGEGNYGANIQQRYHLYPFFDQNEMALAYAAADIIISRAGSGSIYEIAAVGKPTILIPLSTAAANHQLANAVEFAKFGGSFIEEANLTPHILINQIENLLEPGTYAAVSEKIKSFATPQAASQIAETIIS